MDSAIKVRLSPRRVAVVMDDTFRIYRDNFVTFVALVALVTVPLILINTGIEEVVGENDFTTFEEFSRSSEESLWIQVGLFVVGVLLNVIVVFSFICHVASENFLGRKATIIQAVRAARGRLLPLTGAVVLSAIVLGVLSALSIAGAAIFIGILLMPVVAYLALTVYFFLLPVMILEKVGIFFGIRRALALGKTRFWAIFGFVFGATLIVFIMGLALAILGEILADTTADAARFVRAFINSLILVLVLPIFPIGMTLMYYDTRVRVEGIDIAFAVAETSDPRPSDLFSPRPVGRVLGTEDARNIFVLACAGPFLLFVLGSIMFGIALAIAGP